MHKFCNVSHDHDNSLECIRWVDCCVGQFRLKILQLTSKKETKEICVKEFQFMQNKHRNVEAKFRSVVGGLRIQLRLC